jgi:HEPN domain-containing protein
MDTDQIVQYWCATAKDDLTAAEHLFESGDHSHALFFGHLYLEKLLKASVVQHTRRHAPLTHNLRLLAERANLKLSAEQQALLVRVTEYNVRARYPDWALQFKRQCTRELCERELGLVKEFGEWVLATVIS